MPRKQTTTASKNVATETDEKPENIVIVPHGIARQVDPEVVIDIENRVKKKFEVNQKRIVVFENGNQIDECNIDDEKLQNYLKHNDSQLKQWIDELNETVTEPNMLILFNVGKQTRTYMTYDSYFSQNGLAPVPCTITSFMQYYKNQSPASTDEEIAINVKGNLTYSFTLIQ